VKVWGNTQPFLYSSRTGLDSDATGLPHWPAHGDNIALQPSRADAPRLDLDLYEVRTRLYEHGSTWASARKRLRFYVRASDTKAARARVRSYFLGWQKIHRRLAPLRPSAFPTRSKRVTHTVDDRHAFKFHTSPPSIVAKAPKCIAADQAGRLCELSHKLALWLHHLTADANALTFSQFQIAAWGFDSDDLAQHIEHGLTPAQRNPEAEADELRSIAPALPAPAPLPPVTQPDLFRFAS